MMTTKDSNAIHIDKNGLITKMINAILSIEDGGLVDPDLSTKNKVGSNKDAVKTFGKDGKGYEKHS